MLASAANMGRLAVLVTWIFIVTLINLNVSGNEAPFDFPEMPEFASDRNYHHLNQLSSWQETLTTTQLRAFGNPNTWRYNGSAKFGHASFAPSRLDSSKLDTLRSEAIRQKFLPLDQSTVRSGKSYRKFVMGYARDSKGKNKKRGRLIVFVPGTGSSHLSPMIEFYSKFFVDSGYDMVSVPSPLHWQFIIGGSSSGRVGNVEQDSKDLYQGLAKSLSYYGFDRKYSEIVLVGASLGALNAAHMARYDLGAKRLFKKVVLLNPPVDLSYSIEKLESLKGRLIPHAREIAKLIFNCLHSFRDAYKDLSKNELFYKYLVNLGSGWCSDSEATKKLIYWSMSSFIGDSVRATVALLYSQGSLTKRRAKELFKNADKMSFTDYLREFAQDSSRSPLDYLRQFRLNGPKLQPVLERKSTYVFHNENDFIIDRHRHIQFLKKSLGERAFIYQRGGHMGNAWYDKNLRNLQQILEDR